MVQLLDSISYPIAIGLAVFLGFAPFVPEPHIVEKLRMLSQGTLTRPLDIFDLLLHLAPLVLLLAKVILDLSRRGAS
ncbi:MAG: RND transporter [Spirochaetota bacterium]